MRAKSGISVDSDEELATGTRYEKKNLKVSEKPVINIILYIV